MYFGISFPKDKQNSVNKKNTENLNSDGVEGDESNHIGLMNKRKMFDEKTNNKEWVKTKKRDGYEERERVSLTFFGRKSNGEGVCIWFGEERGNMGIQKKIKGEGVK